MQVKLISITPNAETLVAYCARVSNKDNQCNDATASKLLKYLVKHKHWSPFEMAHAVLEITTTRDISRQILRHRSFSFQEFSQRYAEVKTLVDREPREQDIKNRQNSFAMPSSDWRVAEWYKQLHRLIATAKWTYDHAIEMGIAKEQARVVLPEGLTETTLYMAGNIRSWIHYCEVRRGPETQLEHRNIANACWSIITNEMPSLATILD